MMLMMSLRHRSEAGDKDEDGYGKERKVLNPPFVVFCLDA